MSKSPDLLPLDSPHYQNNQGQAYANQPNAQTTADPYAVQYDPNNVQYQQVSVQQWSSIPAVRTDYSDYWATPQSFEPQHFSENTKKESKCRDIPWTIAFWINFAVTICVFGWLLSVKKNEVFLTHDTSNTSNVTYYQQITDEDFVRSVQENEFSFYATSNSTTNSTTIEKFTKNDFFICVGIAFGVAFVINIINFFLAICCPVCYVNTGLIFSLVVAVATTLWITVVYKYYYFFVFPAIYLLFVLCWYCLQRAYIKITAAVMKVGMKIILRFPGTIFLPILWAIIDGLISALFSYMFYAVFAIQKGNSYYWLYLYFILSYLWISLTFYYIIYMAIAGVAASWYFLNDTEYMPASPTLQSFKRAITTSFGSASEAAFILALIRLMEVIVQTDFGQSSENAIVSCVYCCVKCVLLCILRCLYSIFGFLNKWALIYCATFGVPYKEGIRRFGELNSGRFVTVIMSSNVLDSTMTFMNLGFTVAAGVIGWGLGCIFRSSGNYYKIWCCACSCIFTFCLFLLFQGPIQVCSDTLLVCFAENPERLETTACELAEALKETYNSGLEKKCHSSHRD